MSDLAQLQKTFQRHVYRRGAGMTPLVLETTAANAARRLGVYADGYALRLTGALAMDYPALQGLLGEAAFNQAMRDFVAAVPSRHPNLRWYGGQLAGFLKRSPRWGRRPILAELARFEWVLGLAFDAKDAVATTMEQVAGLNAADWPLMRMQLQPSVQILRLRGDVPAVWRAAIADQKPDAAALKLKPSVWLVWRKGQEPFFRTLTAEEAWALGAVARGRNFAALCGGLRRFVGAQLAAQTGAQFLRNWLSEGLLCGIETGLSGA